MARAPVFVVDDAKRRLVNYRQAQRPAYFRNGDFLAIQEQVPIQVAARLEVSAAKDEERAVGGVNEFTSAILHRSGF